MNFLKKVIDDNKDALVEYIFDDELKDKVVTAINENVNVPLISEKTEGKIIDALYDSIEEVVDMIKQINSGEKNIDSDRWRLLKKELR